MSLLARGYRTAAVLWTAVLVANGYLALDLRTRRAPAEERARRMAEQHRRSAERLAALAGHLRGLLTKSCQYLSGRPDLLPEAYIEPLARLQDSVPPRPYRQIARQIQRELGRPPEELFASFDKATLASASLAQVHYALLHDGRRVAVKVQYEGIESLVSADIHNLGLIVAIVARIWPRYDFRTLYGEIRRLVPAELDFQHEAGNAERIARELSDRPDVYVPEIVHEYSTRRVLTMAYVDGIRIGDLQALHNAGLDLPALAERIVSIFGAQVIEHGFYHGDPHPGNIFALRDGRIALIDFGQALELTMSQRRAFAEMAMAGRAQDPAGMIAAVRVLGIGLPDQDNTAFLTMAATTFASAGPNQQATGTEADAAGASVLLAQSFRNVSLKGVTGETLCVFRVQGLLRGLRARLGSPGPVIVAWEPYARALLQSHAEPAGGDASPAPE
jgi:predicted unusual protein kinase regulating ubiquinone biosynthesis (AarF/ABC1/UbiB family)